MSVFHMVLAALIVLGPLIAIHEFGHFIVARRMGVKVLTYSIGFGPALVTWGDRKGTRYQLAVIPLGGFVRFADEREGEVAPEDLPRAFNRQPVLARMAIVAAGPVINLVFAVFLYWILFLQGTETLRPVIGRVFPQTPAAVAGIVPGDEITAVDGKPVADWEAINYALIERMGESGTLTLTLRPVSGGETRQLSLGLNHFMAGRDVDPFREVGFLPWSPPLDPVVGDVLPEGAAARQGLRTGDRVLVADGVTIRTWQDFVEIVRAQPEQRFDVQVRRGQEVVTLHLTPAGEKDDQGIVRGRLGVGVHEQPIEYPAAYRRTVEHGVLDALGLAFAKTGTLIAVTLQSMGKMVQGLISVNNLSGPITIAKVAGQTAAMGWEALIGFMALLSVSLGVLNLLPIPVLDGGHLVYYGLEGVLGRPVSERMQMLGVRIGIVMLMSLMLLAIFNDLSRL
ncbi:MAG TPA: RIP metalloprotease RseP [Moraxellaceae bacterium]|nr:RIP metalloprotease RseP [Moraxellaceae bacterium]